MNDVFTYFVPLPNGINEMAAPCPDGYTIYIDVRLDRQQREKAYEHALRHILSGDFERLDAQEIEENAHLNA